MAFVVCLSYILRICHVHMCQIRKEAHSLNNNIWICKCQRRKGCRNSLRLCSSPSLHNLYPLLSIFKRILIYNAANVHHIKTYDENIVSIVNIRQQCQNNSQNDIGYVQPLCSLPVLLLCNNSINAVFTPLFT